MSLRIYNTLGREVQAFEPLDPENVRVYVCGPTVYDYAHIGNARPVVIFDILVRLLRHIYGARHVTYVTNITDIDDKIMDKARKEGIEISEVARRYADAYEQDMSALGALEPDAVPRATETLPEMQAMMKTLIEKGHAYEAEGHILFHVPSMKSYGKLSRRPRDELIAGARVEVAPYKKDPADFVMWKPSTDDQPGWDSPWGRGRPGWHLECSCMIEKHLGDTIDIHGGGLDLVFPHHENEIAQSECAHNAPFSRYWMHNGMLEMSGEKMAKSLGNIETVRDLLKDFPGEALRLSLLTAHYRQPLEFNRDIVREQQRRLDRWYRVAGDVESADEVPPAIIRALEDDLNTPKVLAELEKLANPDHADELKAGAQFLGLLEQSSDEWFKSGGEGGLDEAAIEALIEERKKARENRNFARADEIRDELTGQGIALEDSADGTRWRRVK